MAIHTTRFQELLAKAKILTQARKEEDAKAAIESLQTTVSTEKPREVDLSNLGITDASLQTKKGEEDAIETLQEVVSGSPSKILASQKRHTTGVAADVTLNTKQNLFLTTALSGQDVCLVGAAGTGKTTGTGKFIKALIDSEQLELLGTSTKWLRDNVLGVLITSFTRKAVNNIRRAVPEELQPHVLTMHKVLEFQPVFYEIFDTTTAGMKKTMKFEPQRHALNPLPSSLSLIVYEESSMIGTDLYNMMSAAMPHNPQEIFIGDIRQLPPIFGPAILGFKMSLLPVIELDEVYRQALLSPIIRLAHAVLSGDATLFSPKVEVTPEGKKIVPSLEKFNEAGEYGSVKINCWVKKLPEIIATGTAVQQFIAWEKSGYYNPNVDVILCPFNKSFGTTELNKGIQNYLGLKRGAVVHEVISGYEKHYLAIGDRILFDKEDAIITDIRRNLTYVGKSPQHAHKLLDRWGTLQEETLSEEDKKKLQEEETEFSLEAMDKFLENFDDDEERVHAASHAIDITFTYSDETMTLSSAAELNSVIGGNAITIHKMQGSEAEAIFVVLHHSHAGMVQNELLYTAITRARSKLHIICEIDTFFKGVKSHKVRGVTLADKIDFFKGKVEYKEMQAEMDMLVRMREVKMKRLEERKNLQKSISDYEHKWEVAKEILDELEVFDELDEEEEFTENDTDNNLHLTSSYENTTIDLSLLNESDSPLSNTWDNIRETLEQNSEVRRESEPKSEPEPTKQLSLADRLRAIKLPAARRLR